MSCTTFSVGLFTAFIVGSLGQTIGIMPNTIPALSMSFSCNEETSDVVIDCELPTYSKLNSVFNTGACYCLGVGNNCQGFVWLENDIWYPTLACKIELYEETVFDGYNAIQYTSISELNITINGYPFVSPTYILPQINTVVFGSNFCNNFMYNDTVSPPLIYDLNHQNCAPIEFPYRFFTSSTALLSDIKTSDKLIIYLPKNGAQMIIADKTNLPLEVQLK